MRINPIGNIAKVAAYHGYRMFRPWDHPGAKRLSYTSYERGDVTDKLEGDLAAVTGHRDNHHGWEVLDDKGRRYFVRFSDWTVSVWSLPDATLPRGREAGRERG